MGVIFNRFGGNRQSILITKRITANNTYSAKQEDADGFSQVTVDVKAARNVLWTGEATGDITVNLSAYKFVYIEVTGGGKLLLEVNGAAGYVGMIGPHEPYATFGTARGYRATSSGIQATTNSISATEIDSEVIKVTAVYGITNIV